jgi:hypothetical protein
MTGVRPSTGNALGLGVQRIPHGMRGSYWVVKAGEEEVADNMKAPPVSPPLLPIKPHVRQSPRDRFHGPALQKVALHLLLCRGPLRNDVICWLCIAVVFPFVDSPCLDNVHVSLDISAQIV